MLSWAGFHQFAARPPARGEPSVGPNDLVTDPETYDAAISFRQEDEPLAVRIYVELGENLGVFVFSKKQGNWPGLTA